MRGHTEGEEEEVVGETGMYDRRTRRSMKPGE